jgi:hypothetical protein
MESFNLEMENRDIIKMDAMVYVVRVGGTRN